MAYSNFSYTNPLLDQYNKDNQFDESQLSQRNQMLGRDYMYNPNDSMFDRQYQRKNSEGNYRFTRAGYNHYFGADEGLDKLPANTLVPPDYQGFSRTYYNNGTIFRPKTGGAFNYGNAYNQNGAAVPTATGYPVYLNDVPANDTYAYGNVRNEGNYVSPMGENGMVSNYGFRRSLLDANKGRLSQPNYNDYKGGYNSKFEWQNKTYDDIVNANKTAEEAYKEQVEKAKLAKDLGLATSPPSAGEMMTKYNDQQNKEDPNNPSYGGDKEYSDDYLKHRNRYDWLVPLKYANVAGSAIGVIGDLLGGTNKPDYSGLDPLYDLYRRKSNATYQPIGNYQKYKPMDRDYYINMINAQVGAKKRAMLDMSNGNRAQAAAMLAGADVTGQQSMADLIMNVDKENLARYDAAKKFNQATDTENAKNFLAASLQNSQNESSKISAAQTIASLKYNIDKDAATNKSANLTSFFNNLAGVGKEFNELNVANDDKKRDYYQTNFGHMNYKPGYEHVTPEQDRANREAELKLQQRELALKKEIEAFQAQKAAMAKQYGTVPGANGYLQQNIDLVQKNNPFMGLYNADGTVKKFHYSTDADGKQVIVIDE